MGGITRNSAMITIPAALLSSMLGSMNGYIFAKWRFPRSTSSLSVPGGHVPSVPGDLIWCGRCRCPTLRLYRPIWCTASLHPITALLFRGY